jgi:hypothetical protein
MSDFIGRKYHNHPASRAMIGGLFVGSDADTMPFLGQYLLFDRHAGATVSLRRRSANGP